MKRALVGMLLLSSSLSIAYFTSIPNEAVVNRKQTFLPKGKAWKNIDIEADIKLGRFFIQSSQKRQGELAIAQTNFAPGLQIHESQKGHQAGKWQLQFRGSPLNVLKNQGKLEVRLERIKNFNLQINTHLSEAQLHLEQFNVQKIQVKGRLSSISAYLPRKVESANFNISGGSLEITVPDNFQSKRNVTITGHTGHIVLNIPQTLGVQINYSGPDDQIFLPENYQHHKDFYRSPHFSTAKSRVIIDLRLYGSSLEISS